MAEPLIRAVGLAKAYRLGGATVQALRGATLDVYPGEFVAIMGPSGSGKSTLMNLLGLLDRPSGGDYHFAGQDVVRLDQEQRALLRCLKIGFVFQSFNLLRRSTALENVELPLIYAGVSKADRRQRAVAALASIGLRHRQGHWPGQLSGGEQQRVAIARALANDPLLILADEPTGALDTCTGRDIMALFQRLNGAGRTIVLVTHEPDIARHADRIISMQDGRAVRDERVLRRADAVAELAGLDKGVVEDAPRLTAVMG